MRREGIKIGRITKNTKSPVKKKGLNVKEEMIDSD